MEKVAVQIRISGIVQGVFFRQSTREKAIELNISGWVCNTADGAVALEAEGEEAAMKEFIGWCHRGPARADVSKVEIKTIGTKNYSGFEIRR